MDPALVLVYLVFAATLGRGLLTAADVLPRTCRLCGRQFERGMRGERVCRCVHEPQRLRRRS